MRFLGGIEGDEVALLPAAGGAAIAVDIGLDPPVFPSHVAQELKVQLVVCVGKYVAIGCLRSFNEEHKTNMQHQNQPSEQMIKPCMHPLTT